MQAFGGRVTRAGRFERRTEYARHDDVVTWLGVDTVTGLPVLIYEIARAPDRRVERLESEVIPGVLSARYDGAHGELVAAFSTTYRALSSSEVDDHVVARAATALVDAADAGIVHGDLRPDRFLIASGHVLVEGFGVPWSPHDPRFAAPEGEPSTAGDVYAFARSLLELAEGRLSPATAAVLERASAEDPEERPLPAALAAELRRAAEAPHDAPRAAPAEVPAEREPLVIDTDPGIDVRKRGGGGKFSKEPPPGTKYTPGDAAGANPPGPIRFPSLHDGRLLGDGSRRWVRFAALGATVALAAVFAFLALSRQADQLSDPTATQAVVYVVEVAIEPANLPPVTLMVVEGPNGSKWQPGTALGTVPGRIVLDREGTWQLQGVFQDRRSRVASLDLPAERSVTLTFLPVAPTTSP